MIYNRHPDIAWREVVDEALVVDPRTGKIYPLNAVGATIWRQLDGTRDVKEIENGIVREFEVPQEEAARDVEEFVSSLKEQQLIVQK